MSQVIICCLHLINNSRFFHNIFPDGLILVAKKRENIKDLLICGDPYNIKHDLTDIVAHRYKQCGKKCDLCCDNFFRSQPYLILNATERKYYICGNSTYSTPNVAYMAYCKKCKKHSAGSTMSWKPRLCNY